MSTSPLTGGCLCAKVRYVVSEPTELVYNVVCHCINCKKASGTHMVNSSIFPKETFTLTSGSPKTFADHATDSGAALARHFCGDCGSPVYITTPMVPGIVAVLSGTLDRGGEWWMPNKEQYIETKSHWLPDFAVTRKEGVVEKHQRGPLEEQKY